MTFFNFSQHLSRLLVANEVIFCVNSPERLLQNLFIFQEQTLEEVMLRFNIPENCLGKKKEPYPMFFSEFTCEVFLPLPKVVPVFSGVKEDSNAVNNRIRLFAIIAD